MSQIYRENGVKAAVADSDPIETRHSECNERIQRPVADTKCDTSVPARHENGQPIGKPSRKEAEAAIRTDVPMFLAKASIAVPASSRRVA